MKNNLFAAPGYTIVLPDSEPADTKTGIIDPNSRDSNVRRGEVIDCGGYRDVTGRDIGMEEKLAFIWYSRVGGCEITHEDVKYDVIPTTSIIAVGHL